MKRQQEHETNLSQGSAGSQEFLMDVVARRSRGGDCEIPHLTGTCSDGFIENKEQKTPDSDSQDFIMELVAARSASRTSVATAMSSTNVQADLVALEAGTVSLQPSTKVSTACQGRDSAPTARLSAASVESSPAAFSVIPTTTAANTAVGSDFQPLGVENSAEISESSLGCEGGDHDDIPAIRPQQATDDLNDSSGQHTMTSGDLTVAQMVVSEEFSYEIQDATPEPTETETGGGSTPRKPQQQKQSSRPFPPNIKAFLCISGIILAVVVALLVLLIPLSAENDNSQEPPQQKQQTSIASTSAPTSLEDRVLSLLPEETARQALFRTQSPQQRALEWLLQDDDLGTYSDGRIIQKYALAAFYYFTNGQDWSRNDNWLNHSTHECEWYNSHEFALKESVRGRGYDGYLTEFDEPALVRCTPEGMIQHIWLDANNLEGTLPEELYRMTSLVTVSIGLNQLVGTLSTRIGDLRQLEAYSLWNQKSFGGTIPTEIGLCTNLRGFGLYDNSHHGTLPTELWKLTKLSSFIMYLMPNLQGSIPTQIGNLSELRWFTMSAIDYRGIIPSELGQLSALEWLNLGFSKFTGTIPSQVGHLSNLGQMVVESNALEGTLPSELGLLTQATLLSFNDNQFHGSIPTHLGLLSNLSLGLSLQNNALSHTLPTELGLLTSLQTLAVQNNNLVGLIPSQLGQMSSAGSLHLEDNALSGTIPLELSELETSLFAFHLGGNPALEGIVPEPLCQLGWTCAESRLNPTLLPCSDEIDGLTFDCTELLCGCGCQCSN